MTAVYDSSVLNRPRRHRSTQAEMTEFRQAVWDLAERYHDLTGRQLYYRAVVKHLVGKDEGKSRANEQRVQAATDYMREQTILHGLHPGSTWSREFWHALIGNGWCADASADDQHAAYWAACRELLAMPFSWLSDNTRTRYQATQYADKDQALREMHRLYRRDLWRAQPFHVEVWCESDALGDVLNEVTDDYGLALLPCRGQAGKRFVYDSAQSYRKIDKPVVVIYVGDFDPAGLDIRKSLHERIARYGAPDVGFRWLAVTPEQVRDQGLIDHGINANTAQPVLERFYAECDRVGIARESVEAEAMEPDTLRDLLRAEIESLIDRRAWEQEQTVEAAEKRILGELVQDQAGGEPS